MDAGNLFKNVPIDLPKELAEVLSSVRGCRIERILSRGHATREGEWFDQEEDEFVILLKGSAGLLFEDDGQCRTMKPGDYVTIPAHRRHRVEWTEEGTDTVWLAVHSS